MDNSTRAKRLAEIFGWVESETAMHRKCWGCEFAGRDFRGGPRPLLLTAEEFFKDEYMLLPWLLRELPRRGYGWQLETMPDDGGFRADICDGKDEYVNGRCVGARVYAAGHPNDPLLALADATISAFERQAT